MSLEILCVEVGAQTYGIRVDRTRAVARADDVSKSGALPDTVGVIRHRGQDIPVISVAAKLGLPAAPVSRGGHIVLTEGAGPSQGWLVSHVIGRTSSADGIALLPPTVGAEARRLFDGLVAPSNQAMLLLAADSRPLEPEPLPAGPPAFSAGAGDRRQPQSVPPLIAFHSEALRLPKGVTAAVRASQVLEVVPVTGLVPVPRAPKGVLGVILWRGMAVPLVHLGDATRPRPVATALVVQERRRLEGSTVIAIPIHGEARLYREIGDAPQATGIEAVNTLYGTFATTQGPLGVVHVGAVARSAMQL